MNESLNLNLDDILSQAVVNNPALTIGKMQVGIASVEQSLALSGLLPEFGVGAYSKKVVDDKKQRYYGVSFSATIPLWFMLDQNGRIKEASATVASAKADLQNTENSIRLQIKSAFNEYKDAERQVAAYHNEILPQAEEVYRSASKSYESGDITYLEFLEAQKTLIDARSNYTEALLDYNLSIITLEQVTAKTIK
jgi:outer membrane protein TolC